VKPDRPKDQLESLGSFIRGQRKAAELTLRDLAEKTGVSNPYLSQLERGLHEPSMRVLSSIAEALEVSIETLLGMAGLISSDDGEDGDNVVSVEAAIAADDNLKPEQRDAILAVYRSYVDANNT
jgi:transcriptional regulator with XRE-family HTH domain